MAHNLLRWAEMNQNVRQFLLICTVASVMIGAISWMIPAANEPATWWVRIITLCTPISVIFAYWWIRNRKDLVPDFFAEREHFFEKEGFAFFVPTEVIENTCHLAVTYQNRCERACDAFVIVRTAERLLAPQRHLTDAKVSIACGPGAYGKSFVPWAIPLGLQGKDVLVDVAAKAKYPKGRGKMLRYRVGLEVGTAPGSVTSDLIKVLGVFAGIHGGRSARAKLSLPENVVSTNAPAPGAAPTKNTILWKLGDHIPNGPVGSYGTQPETDTFFA